MNDDRTQPLSFSPISLDCRTPETVLENARKAVVYMRRAALGYRYSPVLSNSARCHREA